MWLRNFSLYQRLGIIVALIALLFIVLTGIILNRHYQALKDKSYSENKHLVEVVHTMLQSFDAIEGISESEAKEKALASCAEKSTVAEGSAVIEPGKLG